MPLRPKSLHRRKLLNLPHKLQMKKKRLKMMKHQLLLLKVMIENNKARQRRPILLPRLKQERKNSRMRPKLMNLLPMLIHLQPMPSNQRLTLTKKSEIYSIRTCICFEIEAYSLYFL